MPSLLVTEKNEAIKRGKNRDKKYAPFRAHFKECQFKKFLEYKELGKTLTAPTFVSWYLKNKADNINIPYVKSNLYHITHTISTGKQQRI